LQDIRSYQAHLQDIKSHLVCARNLYIKDYPNIYNSRAKKDKVNVLFKKIRMRLLEFGTKGEKQNTDEIVGIFGTKGKKQCLIIQTTLVCTYA
jgi:hypothetical protein